MNRVEKIVRRRHVQRREEISGISNTGEAHILRTNSLGSARKGVLSLPRGKRVRGDGKNRGIRLSYTD